MIRSLCEKADVCIIGSGPAGATFARLLEESGKNGVILEAGAQHSPKYGENLKNAALYQRNKTLFSHIVRGQLNPVSVASTPGGDTTGDAASAENSAPSVNGTNPEQDPSRNLPEAGITHAVGGMATHWTGTSPRQHPVVERSPLLTPSEWDRLYTEAERILRVSTTEFDDSIAHQLVLDALREEYKELEAPYDVQSLPLAAQRRAASTGLVEWTGVDTILGPLAAPGRSDRFRVLSQHLCTRLATDSAGSRVSYAEAQDLLTGESLRIEADSFVVAGGGVATAQLMWASCIRPSALGRYLTDHPLAFCQVVLLPELVKQPIPEDDLEPNVWIPLSASRPWHCMIHRDAFQYGDRIPNVDRRLVVDLRWHGMVEPRADNRVTFSDQHRDKFGLPQPTFDFTLSASDRAQHHAMMSDMLRAAMSIGGFLPGAEPRFMPLGLSQHIAGATRMGNSPEDSVVDCNSRVWGIDNLYLGGNNVIPTATACNPTLTSVALAVKAARHLSNG
ncbi:GMC family oxidoreductase [Nocardiopsis rhodophaea]|uniref:GMC family oxidoreductase n=1 Tax=Nocardiopsis rhodophaea TaxID=280238 RepID=A0ABN2S8Z7_9ACTN